jgi:hypothetical protein
MKKTVIALLAILVMTQVAAAAKGVVVLKKSGCDY